MRMRMSISLCRARRCLRASGMREAVTEGGAHILYCGPLAMRLVNDYTLETWNPYETRSGVIKHYDTHEQLCDAMLLMGLESMGVI